MFSQVALEHISGVIPAIGQPSAAKTMVLKEIPDSIETYLLGCGFENRGG